MPLRDRTAHHDQATSGDRPFIPAAKLGESGQRRDTDHRQLRLGGNQFQRPAHTVLPDASGVLFQPVRVGIFMHGFG